MKKTILYIVLAALCFFLTANAQNYSPRGLKIGDKVPDIIINNIINSPASTLKMSDFKGKILILDFWATWCTSCLGHFSLADSLQNEFQNDIQILLVNALNTKDTKEKILKTLQASKGLGNVKFSLPTVIQDTLLGQLFPHYYIPHYVWIGKDGTVIAITSADGFNRENIVHILKGQLAIKYQKIDFDPQRPLYTVEYLPKDNLQQFSILLKGNIDGIGEGTRVRYFNDTARGIVFNNRGLLDLYARVCEEKIPGSAGNRIAIVVKDPSKLSWPASKLKRPNWERENFYSYELIVPANQFNHFFDFMLDDLNRYLPYHASVEKRVKSCWILERAGKKDMIHTHGGKYENTLGDTANARLVNSSLLDLCTYLNEISGNAIILDKTGYTPNIDLEFKKGVKDMAAMQKALKAYGLKLYAACRKVDMLIIKDK